MLAKKTFEINPHHPVIKEMLNKVRNLGEEDTSEELSEYADLLYNMALLNSGFLIENPTDMTVPLQKLLKIGFGLKRDEPIEEIEVDISTIEEEEGETAQEEPDVPGEIEVEEPESQPTSEEL